MATDKLARAAASSAGAAAAEAQSVTGTTARLQWWLRQYNGPVEPFDAMASPPTVTVGSSTSFNGRSSGNESVRWDSPLLTHIGSNVVSDGASPTRAVGQAITAADNSLSAGTTPIRTRFTVFGNAFGAMFRGTAGAYVNAIIDGKYAIKTAATNPIFRVMAFLMRCFSPGAQTRSRKA
jgi:hypothetical protein